MPWLDIAMATQLGQCRAHLPNAEFKGKVWKIRRGSPWQGLFDAGACQTIDSQLKAEAKFLHGKGLPFACTWSAQKRTPVVSIFSLFCSTH